MKGADTMKSIQKIFSAIIAAAVALSTVSSAVGAYNVNIGNETVWAFNKTPFYDVSVFHIYLNLCPSYLAKI